MPCPGAFRLAFGSRPQPSPQTGFNLSLVHGVSSAPRLFPTYREDKMWRRPGCLCSPAGIICRVPPHPGGRGPLGSAGARARVTGLCSVPQGAASHWDAFPLVRGQVLLCCHPWAEGRDWRGNRGPELSGRPEVNPGLAPRTACPPILVTALHSCAPVPGPRKAVLRADDCRLCASVQTPGHSPPFALPEPAAPDL